VLSKSSFNQILDRGLLKICSKLPLRLVQRVLWLLQTHPEVGDRWNYHIRQHHFYEPWPRFQDLISDHILARRENPSINWAWDQQLALLQDLEAYQLEVEALTQEQDGFDFQNSQFREFDAAIYYTLLRHLKPKTIIEVGSGYSTQVAHRAIAQNQQHDAPCSLICVEPYPSASLLKANLPIQLIQERLEHLDLGLFKQLQSGDILFIDSTHTVKFNSDVCREFLEIIPTLNTGVWIHIHDIFFPLDYPPHWLIQERRAWNEQYLVEAFLSYNTQFDVKLANHWVALDYPEEAAKVWPKVRDWQGSHHCGSLWLRKRAV